MFIMQTTVRVENKQNAAPVSKQQETAPQASSVKEVKQTVLETPQNYVINYPVPVKKTNEKKADDRPYVDVWKVEAGAQTPAIISVRGIDLSGSNQAANSWGKLEDAVSDDAKGMQNGKVAVVLFGVTKEQYENIKTALVAAGVDVSNIKYDDMSCVGFSVDAKLYGQAALAAVEAKKTGPKPGQGMTDLFGAQLMGMQIGSEIYQDMPGSKVDEIRKFVENNPDVMKHVATTGGMENPTDWYYGKYSEKNDWFVGAYKDSKTGQEYDVIMAKGAENWLCILPKGALEYKDFNDIQTDFISFSNTSFKPADLNKGIVRSQRDVLENVTCFSAVKHVLINDGKDDMNKEGKKLLEGMGQEVENLSEQKAKTETKYFALRNGEALPPGAQWADRIYFDPTTIVTYGDKETDEKIRKVRVLRIPIPHITTGLGSVFGGGRSGGGNVTCEAYHTPGYSGSGGGNLSMLVTGLVDWKEFVKVKIKDKHVPYKTGDDGKLEFKPEWGGVSPLLPNYKPWENLNFLNSLMAKAQGLPYGQKKAPGEVTAYVSLGKADFWDSDNIGSMPVTFKNYKKTADGWSAEASLVWNGKLIKITLEHGLKNGTLTIDEGRIKTELVKNYGNIEWSLRVDPNAFANGEYAFASRVYSIMPGKKKLLDIATVSLDKGKTRTEQVTAENYSRLLPFIVQNARNNGNAVGDCLKLTLPEGSAPAGQDNSVIILYHRESNRPIASDLAKDELTSELVKRGCDAKAVEAGANSVNENTGYTIMGSDGRAFIVMRDPAHSNRYRIYNGVVGGSLESENKVE
ncbi:MAG: hypothetical protein NTX79_02940 [Candidatus Micrarchaeota archaeon]|nr:hypothetical protein [Candidatus Micrarchaeota archaeon]